MQDDSLESFLENPVFQIGPIHHLVGTTIVERYFVESQLSEGVMSEVYLARDLRLSERQVVIKVLSKELFKDEYGQRKFKQEVEALSRIRHSGVVEVLDIGELDDARPFLVMQFVDGETLRSQIPSEGMNLEHAASILKQIGNALEHVHQKGIFHRDLKPENVMLKSNTDNVVLIDFGIARVKDSVVAASTVGGTTPGTLVYMSPDQIRGEELTPASDIYAMGVVAYEMVTGRRPFTATSTNKLLELQKKGVHLKPHDLRENLSPKAQKMILRALSFEPKDRYHKAGEFGDELASALIEPSATTKSPSRKVVVASLLVLLVVGLASLGLYKYLGSRANSHPSRSFTYFLTVQKLRDGQLYQDPFKSNGDETFENGDTFRLTTFAPLPGYLYLLREGPLQANEPSFAMIYPRAAISNGSASLGANQSVESDWVTFRGPSGSDNFWIVWSLSPVPQLETAKIEAFKHAKGGLDGQTLVSVKEYLTTRQSEIDASTYRYKASQTAVVRGKSDVLVTLAQFKHR